MSVKTIKTQDMSLRTAAAFPNQEGRIGASRWDFPQLAFQHPAIKAIPLISTPESSQAIVSSDVTHQEGLVADTAWTARTAFEQLPVAHLPGGIIADEALGTATMSNFIRGILNLKTSYNQLKNAKAIDDEDAEISAGIDIATGATQTVFGATYTGVRTTTIASMLHPASRSLAGAAAVFSSIGNIVFLPFNALTVGWGAFQSHRAHQFYKEYERQGKTFQALTRSVYVSPDKITQMILDDRVGLRIEGETALKKTGVDPLLRSRYASLDGSRKAALLNTVLSGLFSKEYPELLAMKEFYFPQLDQKTVNSLDLPTVIGLLINVRKLQLKNEGILSQALGSDCLDKIKRAATRGLEARMASSHPDVKEAALAERATLLAEVDTNYVHNQKLYKTLAILGAIGLVLGIAAFLATGHIGLIVMAVLCFAYALSWVIFDVYSQSPTAFTGKPGRYDKLFLGLRIAVTILGIVLAIGAISVLTGGVPLILGLAFSLALGAVMLGIYIHTLYKLKKQQRKWKEDHPEVQTLSQRLVRLKTEGQTEIDRETLALFKKLPKEARQKITDEAAQAGSRKEIQYNLLSEIEKERFARAVKKTTKFFWTQWWYSNKHNYFQQQALILEELLASIKNGHIEQARHIYSRIDVNVQEKLHDNIQRVFKREESVTSLSDAVEKFHRHQFQLRSA